jgi:tetratricopeptide (TPR) repeat protein
MIRLLTILMLAFPIRSPSQDVGGMLKEAQQLEAGFHENEAFLKYAAILRIQPANIIALCKCSELCSRIGARQPDKEKKGAYFRAAKSYAAAALRVNPDYSEANFVMAFALGRLSLYSAGREKLSLVKDIKVYADRSVREDPGNFKPYHVLGRWNYEVSNLSFTDRSIARWFYGGLPPASLKDAIINFEKSLSLKPSFLLNYLELARAYERNDEKKKAIALLNTMLQLPNGMLDDTRVKREGAEMLKKLQ